ncbi:hypothetical protein PCANB_001696 [Pneumocystis canis]|nr:hypothetical protein PCANB_001696 [Pneumocystis canis]
MDEDEQHCKSLKLIENKTVFEEENVQSLENQAENQAENQVEDHEENDAENDAKNDVLELKNETENEASEIVDEKEMPTDIMEEAEESLALSNEPLPGAYVDEKESSRINSLVEEDMFIQMYNIQQGDPFPEDPNAPVENQQFTVRAVLVGSFLGAVVTSSNIYMGLKTGFVFGAQLFGAIFGFAILKFVSRTMPRWLGGGYFGPKENCTLQTVATAAGGMSSMFISSIPAMYTLSLLGKGPEEDFWRLVSFTAVSAYYGIFFAIPLRKFYILYQKLVFPTPSACALTIRSLHSGIIAYGVMKRKVWSLSVSFFTAILLRISSNYAPGIMWNWHIFWWFYLWGWKNAIFFENWGWWIQLTPAFFGVGFFAGVNAAYSFFIGSIAAWGIIGPIIANTGVAPQYMVVSPEHLDWRNYYSMNLRSNLNPNGFDPVRSSSPRYWLLWPGVMLMLCASFTEIFMNGSIIWKGIKQASLTVYYRIRHKEVQVFKDAINDPAPLDSQIPTWQWLPLLFLSIVFTCLILFFQYNINIGLSLFSVLLGFLFSFVGVQSSGVTDVNPVSTCAKSSQLIFGAISSAQKMEQMLAQKLNLISGSLAASSASQSVDMIGDLKTGHLLGARPRVQFYAQIFGSFFSIWLSVVLYILFNKAYPCFVTQFMSNFPPSEVCVFGAPAVAAWRAIASAMTSQKLPIPSSSCYVSLGLGIFSIIMIVYKYSFCPMKYRPYIPNFNAVGLGFVIPQTYYATAMLIGAIVAHFWKKSKPISYDIYALAIATGLIAGEGMGGVINAVLQTIGLSGYKYGTLFGCSYNSWCD